MITRSFYISLVVFNLILFVGGWLLRHSEAGVQAIVVVAFTVGLTVLHVLDDRDRRRMRRGQR
jgi:hypothetical protein